MSKPSSNILRFPEWVIKLARNNRMDCGCIQVVEESRYSCLMPHHFTQVGAIYAQAFGYWKPRKIIDATAHIGCDSIMFHAAFRSANIVALEIDSKTATVLDSNMKKMSRINCGNNSAVTAVNMDCMQYFESDQTAADIIYFDPPWGGSQYKNAAIYVMLLNAQPLGNAVKAALLHSPHARIIIRVPYNADIDDLETISKLQYTQHIVRNPRGGVAFMLLISKAVSP